jgi:hypothetical protein
VGKRRFVELLMAFVAFGRLLKLIVLIIRSARYRNLIVNAAGEAIGSSGLGWDLNYSCLIYKSLGNNGFIEVGLNLR